MPTWSSDDLAQVLIAPGREFAGFAQGIIRQWNPDTFENVVDVRGGRLTNLPVKPRTDALSFQAGDVVQLSRWKLRSGRGSAVYWIDGAPLFPADGRAEEAVAFMRGQLAAAIINDLVAQLLTSPAGQELAAFAIGSRVKGASVETEQSRTSTSYGDLTTVGPTVVDVPVSESGSAVVFIGAGNKANVFAGAGSSGGYMAFSISGATTRAANDSDSMRCTLTNSTGAGVNQLSAVRAVMGIEVSGLNPGLHTFTAKYRAFSADRPGIFVSRNLVVIGL